MQNSYHGLSLIDSINHFITSNVDFLSTDNIPVSGEKVFFLKASGKLYENGVWKSSVGQDSWVKIKFGDTGSFSGLISVNNAPGASGYTGVFTFNSEMPSAGSTNLTTSMNYFGSDFDSYGHSIRLGLIGKSDASNPDASPIVDVDGVASMLTLAKSGAGEGSTLNGSALFYGTPTLPSPYKNFVLELDNPEYVIRFDDIEGNKRYYATKQDILPLGDILDSYHSTTVVSGSGTDTITHNISWGIWDGSTLGYTTDSSRVSGWTDLSDNLYVINTTLPLTTNLPTAGSATYSLMPLVSSLDSGDLTGGTITANFTTQKVSADLSFSMAGIDYKLINADQSLANLQKNSGVPLDVSLAPSAIGVSEFLNKGNIKGRFLGVDAQVLATKIELRKTDEVTKVQGIAIFNK
jgi:hypothetical protein